MSTIELGCSEFEDNPHFDLMGINGDACFVRLKRLGAICKLHGRPTEFMLAQIAPLTWWREHFPKRTGWMSASSAFVRAAARKGFYDEAGIARRRIADEKRAAQPAPVITENGLPAALVVKETKTYFHVRCPFCGDEHRHGAPLLGARVPHCSMNYPGIGNYEIVRGDPVRSKTLAAA